MNRRSLIASFVAAAVAPRAFAAAPVSPWASYVRNGFRYDAATQTWLPARKQGYGSGEVVRYWRDGDQLRSEEIDPRSMYVGFDQGEPGGDRTAYTVRRGCKVESWETYDEASDIPAVIWNGVVGRYKGFTFFEPYTQSTVDLWRQLARKVR